MNPVIAVCGSVKGEIRAGMPEKAKALGEEIAKRGSVMLTGACPGLPFAAAEGAKAHGGRVIGISPAFDRKGHTEEYKYPAEIFDLVVYTGFGFKGKNVIMARTADAVIILAGGIGTLNEFTIASDEGKIIGILTGAGGLSDDMISLNSKLGRDEQIVCSDDPVELVGKVMAAVEAGPVKRAIRK